MIQNLGRGLCEIALPGNILTGALDFTASH